MSDQPAKAGHHPFHAPVGVLLDEGDRAASKCLRCDTCDGFPCLVHAKADAETICVRPALRDGNLTMVRNAEVRRLGSMLEMLGMHRHLIPNTVYFRKTIGLASVGHQAGTVRFGTDPRTSALDRDRKAHELDNLYVVDTSFFPSIGAVNPSLTAIANALRVGDHIDRRLAA
jgi:choline dehydrogenase-like flavoprotein